MKFPVLVLPRLEFLVVLTLSFLSRWPNRRAVDDEVRNDALKSSLVFIISRLFPA
jgi:hypothetical protein